MDLPDEVFERVRALSELGNAAVSDGDYSEGLQYFAEAFALLPEPKEAWEAATWLLTAIGETHFFLEDFEAARSALLNAMHCPNAIGNPLIHLRLGQVQFELGNDVLAADEMARAYMGAGRKIFEREDQKYFHYLTTVLDEPPGGW